VTSSLIIAAFQLTSGVFAHEPGGGGAAVPGRASEACGGCHGAAFADWSGSGHASAWTSPLFRAGFKVEPRRFCVECHAGADAERAAEGIGCLGCHEARSAAPARGHVAALRSREELRSATACKDCHEFTTPAFDDGAARPTSLPMQSTYSEWAAYRRAGGGETCQGCHMPQGRHVMSGAHDVELLRGALAVAVSDGALTITSVGVGHSFPTGDVFRHLTVEVREVREDGGAPGAWRVVARLGRRFDTRLDGDTLLARKVETADTSLRPGEARVVRLPAAAKSWRVRYHYGSERDERRSLVPDSALFATLAEGAMRQH
jgi:Cytochrome c554 and c-prime